MWERGLQRGRSNPGLAGCGGWLERAAAAVTTAPPLIVPTPAMRPWCHGPPEQLSGLAAPVAFEVQPTGHGVHGGVTLAAVPPADHVLAGHRAQAGPPVPGLQGALGAGASREKGALVGGVLRRAVFAWREQI